MQSLLWLNHSLLSVRNTWTPATSTNSSDGTVTNTKSNDTRLNTSETHTSSNNTSWTGDILKSVDRLGSIALVVLVGYGVYRFGRLRATSNPVFTNANGPDLTQSAEYSRVRRAYHELELERLRQAAEWQNLAHKRANKAAADYQYRKSKRVYNYQSWVNSNTTNTDFSDQDDSERHFRNAYHRSQSHSSSQTRDNHLNNANIQSEKDAALVLGIEPAHVSLAKVKSSFHRLALLHHPDMATGNEQNFKRVADAYDILITSLENKKLHRRASN